MPFWPFTTKSREPLDPAELRDRLIAAAASGSPRQLRKLCARYREQVNANLTVLQKPPEAIRSDPSACERYVQSLIVVAQCLASECAAPELWNKLHGTPADNPILRVQQWYADLPERTNRLEYAELIAEAQSFLEIVRSFQGPGGQTQQAMMHGYLGNLLFNSGHVVESEDPLRTALEICRQTNDLEGQEVYLTNLLEVCRYLNKISDATHAAEELASLSGLSNPQRQKFKRGSERIRAGEPLCRIVCVQDDEEMELDELPQVLQGKYQFQFRRNRPSLQMTGALVRQGNELASSGELANALDKYETAAATDPYDPDPHYQSGTCLLELGAYKNGREAFEEVERLAPGWFHSRTDRWLAKSLEEGTVTDEQFRTLRGLVDGGLTPKAALGIARQAVDRHPDFAPLYLALGDLERANRNPREALTAYRRGLALVEEPDLETRLLAALIATLPPESEEKTALIDRALSLEGNLVARASVILMKRMQPK